MGIFRPYPHVVLGAFSTPRPQARAKVVLAYLSARALENYMNPLLRGSDRIMMGDNEGAASILMFTIP